MICPDCKGKKVIELWASVAPCELCKATGTVADPVPVQSFAPADWKPEEPRVFDPADLPIDLYPPQMPADISFDDSLCILMVAKEDGLLYQANDETGKCRPLGKELICMIDGYSNRDKWVDFRFYPPGGCKPSIARMTCSTTHREMDLQAIQVRHLQHYRVTPILLGDRWEITVMGYDDYQAINRPARAGYRVHPPVISRMVSTDPNVQNVQKEFFNANLGESWDVKAIQDKIIDHALKSKQSLFLEVPGGLGKTEVFKDLIRRYLQSGGLGHEPG